MFGIDIIRDIGEETEVVALIGDSWMVVGEDGVGVDVEEVEAEEEADIRGIIIDTPHQTTMQWID